ncbi:MAG: septum formation initiator family protein [Candidatus Staskawiczbacteria bacterium]|jgi:cell division protein FtsB
MIADFRKKQKTEISASKVAFRIGGILFILIIAVLIAADIKIYQKKKELDLKIADYEKQIADIKKNIQTVKGEIANSNNPDYIEKIAYEQLGEQKPGENEVIFITPPNKKSQSALPAENSWTSWFLQSWNWLKSKF